MQFKLIDVQIYSSIHTPIDTLGNAPTYVPRDISMDTRTVAFTDTPRDAPTDALTNEPTYTLTDV